MKKIFLSFGLCSTLFSAPPENPTVNMPVTQGMPLLNAGSLQHSPIQSDAPFCQPKKEKKAFTTVGLSCLMPGLGHLYLGKTETASYLFGTALTGSLLQNSSFVDEPTRDFSSSAVANTWFYGIYAAYRDVRLYNSSQEYKYKMPTDMFADLAYAPINPSILKKPEVWGGILGSLGAAFGITYLRSGHEASASRAALPMRPLAALPIAIGEEALFRGCIQPLASEMFTPWGGLATSSVLFGAAHISNAYIFYPNDSEARKEYFQFSLPLITAFGLYSGWLAQKNCSLKETVAIHAWYDFTLFMLDFFSKRAAMTVPVQFVVQIPF